MLIELLAWKASWAHRTGENEKKDNDKIKKSRSKRRAPVGIYNPSCFCGVYILLNIFAAYIFFFLSDFFLFRRGIYSFVLFLRGMYTIHLVDIRI